MNKVDYTEALQRYMEEERRAYDSLSLADISEVMNVLEEARRSGGRIYICGNGGSAATASHFVCDFNKGVSIDHDQEQKYEFVCLNDNVPIMMAIANDICYEDIFVAPLRGRLGRKDVVIGISGSGNSENVVRAISYAREQGIATVALTGYDGGRLKELAQYSIHVPVHNMQIAEDVHMMLDHLMMYVLCQSAKK